MCVVWWPHIIQYLNFHQAFRLLLEPYSCFTNFRFHWGSGAKDFLAWYILGGLSRPALTWSAQMLRFFMHYDTRIYDMVGMEIFCLHLF